MDQTNSECTAGFLHDYRIVSTHASGTVERCRKCLDTKYFKNDIPNHLYLSYHLRSALQRDHRRFNKEYAKNN